MQQACGLIGPREVGYFPSLHACCPGSPFGNGSTNLNVPAGETRTLTGDRDYHDVTIGSGGTLDTRGYRLRVCGTLLNWGTITDTSGDAGGAGGAGGKGANPKGSGSDPTGCGRTSPNCTPGQPGEPKVGRGGKGGCGGGGGGGAWSDDIVCQFDTDGGNGGNGGSGGRGGGDVLIYAYRLDNRGVIHADGQPGANGQAAPPGDEGDMDKVPGYEQCGAEYYNCGLIIHRDTAGGGGGGGQGGQGGDGGTVQVHYGVLVNSGVIRANGGVGGLGGAGGSSGGCPIYGANNGGRQFGCPGCEGGGVGGRGSYTAGDCATAGQPGANGPNGANGQWQLLPVGFADCNGNLIPDQCDIANGISLDCQPNGIPDECEVPPIGTGPDCNSNGIPDGCELAANDCNSNGVPDDCDIATSTSLDCNGNDKPDECDILDGFSQDCQPNGIPDECDIAAGTSQDTNQNSIPDECECLLMGDLNGSGLVNGLDIQLFVRCFMGEETSPSVCRCGDFTGDGQVTIEDVSPFICVLLGGPWGLPCHSNQDCNCTEPCYCHKENCDDPVGQCRGRPPTPPLPPNICGCGWFVDPVCGCDGVTYDNACVAAAYGVNVRHPGPCEPGE